MPGRGANRTALVALHYQNDVLHPDGKIRLGIAEGAPARGRLIASATTLLSHCRSTGIPIVHVRIAFPERHEGVLLNAPIFRNVAAAGACQEGSWGAEFHAGLQPISGESVVTHGRVNAFFNSTLEANLRALGVTRLIMAGVATNSVVEHSARHAADMGYEVTVVSDACSAARQDIHEASLFNIGLIGRIAGLADFTGNETP
jgi:nicotinamidase-related amidase